MTRRYRHWPTVASRVAWRAPVPPCSATAPPARPPPELDRWVLATANTHPVILDDLLAPQLEASEPTDDDVLAKGGDVLLDQVADRLATVADIGLVEQRRALAVGALVAVARLCRHPTGIHRRDLHCDLVRQLAELRVARDEVRLAVQLDQPLPRLAARLFLSALDPPLGEQLLGAPEIALGVDQRAPAVHDARAGPLPQRLDLFRRDFQRSLL